MNASVLSAWLAEIIILTYRDTQQKKKNPVSLPIPGLPLPSVYASTFVIYGSLAFIPGQGQRVASAVGWGIVLATVLNLWSPNGSVKTAATSSPANTAKTVSGQNIPVSHPGK